MDASKLVSFVSPLPPRLILVAILSNHSPFTSNKKSEGFLGIPPRGGRGIFKELLVSMEFPSREEILKELLGFLGIPIRGGHFERVAGFPWNSPSGGGEAF